MADPLDRPGDHEVDLNRLIANAFTSGGGLDSVVEVVSVLLEGRDKEKDRWRRAWAGADREWSRDRSALARLIVALTGSWDPEGDAAGQSAVAEARVAELTRERDEAVKHLALLCDELRSQASIIRLAVAHELREIGRHPALPQPAWRWLFDRADALERAEAGRPVAQEAKHVCHDACPCEGNPSYRHHMQHKGVDFDCPWCPGPGDVVAQEAGEPTHGRASDFFADVDDEPAGDLEETLRSAVAEAVDRYDPPVARVWRKGDPEPPANIVLLRNIGEGAPNLPFLRRVHDRWLWVGSPDERTDGPGWTWARIPDDAVLTEIEHADDCQGCEQIPGAVHCATEVIEGGDSNGG